VADAADAVADAGADATDAGADAVADATDAGADAGSGAAGGLPAGGGAEASTPTEPAAVVESFEDFCEKQKEKIDRKKHHLLQVATEVRKKFIRAQGIFKQCKTLHETNKDITLDIYNQKLSQYTIYFENDADMQKHIKNARLIINDVGKLQEVITKAEKSNNDLQRTVCKTRLIRFEKEITDTITDVQKWVDGMSKNADDLLKIRKDMQALIDAAKATPAAVTPVPAAVSPAEATVVSQAVSPAVSPAEATVVSPADSPADPTAVTPAVEDASNSAAASIEPAVAVESFKDFCTRTQAEFTKVKGDFDAAKNAFTQAWQKLKKTIKTFEDLHDKNAQSKEATKALYDSTCTEKSQYFTNVKDKNYFATTTKPYTDKLTVATDVFKN
jgi:hypothetical protein